MRVSTLPSIFSLVATSFGLLRVFDLLKHVDIVYVHCMIHFYWHGIA